jgi:long-chain acyl-CoA synthetase
MPKPSSVSSTTNKVAVVADYHSIQSLSEIWPIAAKHYQDILALCDPHAKSAVSFTYSELNQQIQQFAAGLQALGIKPESKVALVSDNNYRWIIADQGIITAGGVDVVRSSSADKHELLYILKDSDSTALVVEDLKTLKKLQPEINELPIELIVLLLDEEIPQQDAPQKIISFKQLMSLGVETTLQPVNQTKSSLATLMYTSGTTGQPKGVMLSHGNFLHQINNLDKVLQIKPGEKFLSILPTWHVYERTGEYFLLSQGATLIYTNIRFFKKDLKEHEPNYMIGVPRLLEAIYEGVQQQFREQSASKKKLVNFFFNVSERYIKAKRIEEGLDIDNLNPSFSDRTLAKIQASILQPLHALGDRLVYQKIRAGIGGHLKMFFSGGGSLSKHLDNFYEIVGIPLLVGYGLTETSPVTNARLLKHNLRGSAGRPLTDTQVRIVDPETRTDLPQGKQGLVLLKGPQVMQGYYKKPEATAKAIDSEGWFDSGDLGWLTQSNDLVLTGRAKDTIVLTNGENIEPQPIEDACVRSPYIDQIMLVGQDQKMLGALIVPNLDALQQWAQAENLNLQFLKAKATFAEVKNSDLYSEPVLNLFRQELNREVKNRPGYRLDDRIGVFEFIAEPFSIENGMMTQTLKIKRSVASDRYRDIIDGMFAKK